jgi:hypothetical protein
VSFDVVLDLPQPKAAVAADPIGGQHARLDEAVDRALADVEVERDTALPSAAPAACRGSLSRADGSWRDLVESHPRVVDGA